MATMGDAFFQVRLLLRSHLFYCPKNRVEDNKNMKKLLTIFAVGVMVFAFAACSGGNISKETEQASESEETYSEISWPDSDIAKLLPVPESTVGRIEWEASYGFVIYVAETSKSEYDMYVDSCKENGFDVDYRAGDDYYYADNAEGYHLSLNYQEDNIMFIRIDDPDENTMIEETSESETTDGSVDAITESEISESEITSEDGIRPEFKEAMDGYEAFFDEYCEFMKKYEDSDNSVSMLGDYADYMSKYADAMSKMSELDDGELSDEEVIYYTEVTARITKKLSEVAQ